MKIFTKGTSVKGGEKKSVVESVGRREK